MLAILSLVTRKNSRHPLLRVGLIAIGIEFLGWRFLRRSLVEHAWASSHAAAIVDNVAPIEPGVARAGLGLYLGSPQRP